MFNLGANPRVRGSGHLILNVLRALTIIGLLAVAASSWIMIVKAGLAGHFSFFDSMAHVIVFLLAIFFIFTELNFFKRYFEANWPVFSDSHSLAWLGAFLIVLGCQVMSNLEKDKYSQKNLSLPMWRLVLASGILNIAFGLLNMIASVIFRDSAQRITARKIRRDGNLAAPEPSHSAYEGYSQHDEKDGGMSRARRLTQMMNPKHLQQQFRRSKIHISKPMNFQHPSNDMETNHLNTNYRDIERNDDGVSFDDDRSSPIIPGLQRPPTALHPVHTGGSRYSEANMSRF